VPETKTPPGSNNNVAIYSLSCPFEKLGLYY